MDNISLSSHDSDSDLPKVKDSQGILSFKEKVENKTNEDTARFLVGEGNREREKNRFQYSYPSLED
jgi:hypothetical protein